jgi:hypothetical protein
MPSPAENRLPPMIATAHSAWCAGSKSNEPAD